MLSCGCAFDGKDYLQSSAVSCAIISSSLVGMTQTVGVVLLGIKL